MFDVSSEADLEKYVDLFVKLMRRYKYVLGEGGMLLCYPFFCCKKIGLPFCCAVLFFELKGNCICMVMLLKDMLSCNRLAFLLHDLPLCS